MTQQYVFYKGGLLRFVGHLDMMRTIHRAIRRADIPIAYSQGFNPHPIMSFANPLGLGLSGEREIMEIRLESAMPCEECMDRLNKELPEGLHVLAVRDIPDTTPAIMSLVEAAIYRIEFPDAGLDFAKAVDDLMQKEKILIKKLGKVKGHKQMVEVDIKPWIYEIEFVSEHTLKVKCACGSVINLKIELLTQKLYEEMGHPELWHEESIAREALLSGPDKGFINYSDFESWGNEF